MRFARITVLPHMIYDIRDYTLARESSALAICSLIYYNRRYVLYILLR